MFPLNLFYVNIISINLKMRVITNNFSDCVVIDLDPRPGIQSPFIVTQIGYAPDDPELRDKMFVLRPDGKWIDINYFFSQSDELKFDEVVFDSLVQIIELLDSLPPKPKFVNVQIDEANLHNWVKSHPDPQSVKEWAKSWIQGYRLRKKQ